jgi:hypothetical protein
MPAVLGSTVCLLIDTAGAFTAKLSLACPFCAKQCAVFAVHNSLLLLLLLLLALLQVDWGSVKWGTYLNILFWNLNVRAAEQLPTLQQQQQRQQQQRI